MNRKTADRTVATAAATSPATTPSFAEAQRRLANRRRERALQNDARARAAAAQNAQAAAARRARLEGGFVERAGVLRVWDGIGSVAGYLSGSGRVASSGLSGSSGSSPGSGSLLPPGAPSSASASGAPAFRVSQVDAELLDEELLQLLRSQVGDALQYIRNGAIRDDWDAEIMLVLRAALFKLSIWDHDATYGAALQNLKYADARRPKFGSLSATSEAVPLPLSKWQKAAYGLVTVGGRYAWTKWEDWLRDNDGEDEYDEERPPTALSTATVQKLSRATSIVSDMYAGAAFVSFLVFLRYGRYRTLLDRVLRMRLVPPTSQVSREVSFEYLNRQLVWHAFTEFLLFLLPLVGINRWRRWASRTWRKTKSAATTAKTKAVSLVKGAPANDEEADAPAEDEKKGEYAFLPERTCAICYQDQNADKTEADIMAEAAAASGVIGSAETDITNPYETVPCGCIYCYVCVATRIEREEGDGWTCLRCGGVVKACRPWSGDVLEPVSVSTGGDGAQTTPGGGRPSSSSTVASGGGVAAVGGSPHKTVGFADDVKGEDDDEVEEDDDDDENYDSSGEIALNDGSKEDDSAVDVTGASSSDTDSEGYV